MVDALVSITPPTISSIPTKYSESATTNIPLKIKVPPIMNAGVTVVVGAIHALASTLVSINALFTKRA